MGTLHIMATPGWVADCLQRREKGDGVSVVDSKGKVHQLGKPDHKRRYFFGLCPACLKIGEHSACSGCLMTTYCSKNCQKSDWKSHKKVCKVLSSLRGSGPHLFHNDPAAQPRVSQALAASLGRDLTQYESDSLTHARICLVCHSADQAALTNCPDCQCVAYCSQDCREEDEDLHQTVCADLAHCIQDYVLQTTLGDRLACYLPPPLNKPTRLPQPFQAVFTEDCEKLFLPEDSAQYRTSQIRQLTFQYTCPATVLHAASLAVRNLSSLSSLVVHLVGARNVEVEQAGAWSLLAARLPHITRLNLVMVGPELGGDTSLPASFTLKANNAVVSFSLVRSDYRQYSRSKLYQEPSLVAALNCGFIFYKSWDSSLDSMLRTSSAPLVFTEYYLQVRQGQN